MSINWIEVQKALYPIKSYEDLCKNWQVSLSYPFVRKVFNKTMPELAQYTRLGVGSDPRHRYDEYAEKLENLLDELAHAGVQDIIDLFSRFSERDRLDTFTKACGIPAHEIAMVMKYLNYWFLPVPKYLGTLVRLDPETTVAVRILQGVGIRTNLDMLEAGDTLAKRTSLAKRSGLPQSIIDGLVNRSDFSRMPWASKATISNIIGAGYRGMTQLARADPEKLRQDFFRYGKSIGKNLKLGNEIENSQRLAKIVPVILQD